jgi:uncharacterized membrane protein YfhO
VAKVDDRPAQLRLTNGAICGLDIPPGARHVALDYAPPSFRIGLWLALIGLVVLGGTMFVLSRRGGPSEAA